MGGQTDRGSQDMDGYRLQSLSLSGAEEYTNWRCFVRDVCVSLEIMKSTEVLTGCYPLPMHSYSQRYHGQSHHEPLGVWSR